MNYTQITLMFLADTPQSPLFFPELCPLICIKGQNKRTAVTAFQTFSKMCNDSSPKSVLVANFLLFPPAVLIKLDNPLLFVILDILLFCMREKCRRQERREE